MNERQAQELEEERSKRLLDALDECWVKNVSVETMRVLVYETGAGSLLVKYEDHLRRADGR